MLQSKEVEYCKLQVNYTADQEVIREKYEEAINQCRKLPVPGFRPGKATDSAIKLKYKAQIADWVKKELLQRAYEDILFETKIKPIGQPQATALNFDGRSFSCELTLMKKPEFELGAVEGLEVPKPHQNGSPQETIEKIMQELRITHGDSKPYEENDFVQMGDKVTMDYRFLSGEDELSDLTKEGILYTIGQNDFPGFDDNLLGMTPGEEREFNFLLNEKEVKAKVLLHMGMRNSPAPLNDELAKKVGYQTYDELRQAVEAAGTNNFNSEKNSLLGEQVKKQLIAMHTFEVPDWLCLMEAQLLSARDKLSWEQISDEMKEHYLSRAKDGVKLALILDSIQDEKPDAALSDMEAINILKNQLQSIGHQNADQFVAESQKNGRLVGLVANIRNEQALQYIISKATIIE